MAKILPPEIREYIRYYELYKKGPLFNVGLLYYPVKLLDIFDILESAEIEMLNKKYKV